VIDVNLSGVFRVAQASAREMVQSGTRGSIVNIASILGPARAHPGLAYAASKAAVVQLTHALALEWAEHGIRVNAIAPGYFETDITATCCARRSARRSSRASRSSASASSPSSTGRSCCSPRTRRRT
jgi:NAD(P)-dependent dehydrogenase (short-subunit alcohol dehydrogenase family)